MNGLAPSAHSEEHCTTDAAFRAGGAARHASQQQQLQQQQTKRAQMKRWTPGGAVGHEADSQIFE